MRVWLGTLLLVSACGARTALPVPSAADAGMTRIDAFVPDDTMSLCGAPVGMPVQLLTPTTMRTSTLRADVHIDTTMWETTPSVIEDVWTWVARPDFSVHLLLAGDTAGTTSWGVDNFVLFEAYDCTGRRTGAALAGFLNGAVTLDGVPVRQLGDNSFEFSSDAISVDSLVPPGAPVHLHTTALDYGGWAEVRSVYLLSR